MIIFWLLWIALASYSFLLAPADGTNTLQLIINLLTGQLAGINPLVVTLFYLMGIWPCLFAAVMLFEDSPKVKPNWFCGASFVIGSFALLPYLALRQPEPVSLPPSPPLRQVLDSRGLAIILAAGTAFSLVYGLTQGNWAAFVQQWRSERFLHVMGIDFVLLWPLFGVFAQDDARRRGAPGSLLGVCGIPLLGALAYLLLRPQLKIEN
jgi:phosphoglycerol transferase MdoB-like AlkP superfamily enzyme